MENNTTSGAMVYKVTEKTRDAANQMKEMATKAVDQAGSQAKVQAASQKERAADKLDDIAEAMHSAGRQLGEESQPVIANLVEKAADRVDEVSGYLHNRDLSGIARDAGNAARSRPALFLGGAFLTGLAIARLLKGPTSTRANAASSGQAGVPPDYDASGLSGLTNDNGNAGVQNDS